VAAVVLEAGEWIYKMIITLVVASIAIAMVGWTAHLEPNTRELQGELMLNRILYSPEGIWYRAEGVTHIGVIDKNNFDQKNINSAFQYPEGYGGARLTLFEPTATTTVYINEATFKEYEVRNQKRLNDIRTWKYTYPVLIRVNDKEVNGRLLVEVLMPEQS
jgi:hypothetical protein